MAKLRILLVDDHEVVRIGLKALLMQREDFEVVDYHPQAHISAPVAV